MEEPPLPDPNTSWPPPISGRVLAPTTEPDPAEEALYSGWRLLILGACCAPPVFLPLAVWQAVAASRFRAGAGMRLLAAAAGVAAFWIGALLFALFWR